MKYFHHQSVINKLHPSVRQTTVCDDTIPASIVSRSFTPLSAPLTLHFLHFIASPYPTLALPAYSLAINQETT
jgi:hypothetical protein